MRFKKCVPTGVAQFDLITNGGLPAGSVVLLFGDQGAGQEEFAYTSIASISVAKQHPDLYEFNFGKFSKNMHIPTYIYYISFARSESDILRALNAYFGKDYYDAIKKELIFKDFSNLYFKHSILPGRWFAEDFTIFNPSSEKEDLINSLINFVDAHGNDALIVIDSLTDLVVSESINMHDVVMAVKGMQRMSKKWDGLIYLILTRDVISKSRQQILMDSVDGVLTFEWSRSPRSSFRRRYMYIEKFTALLPHIEREKIARFVTAVTESSGLVIMDRELID
jgi:KaiC/GvpD/RAD55 family RecA-like ATPase